MSYSPASGVGRLLGRDFLKEEEKMWKKIQERNEKVRELLKAEHCQKDVVVRIGPQQFFGIWLWRKEHQSHTRVPVDKMRASKDIVLCARSLTLVPLSEQLKPLG